jgi:8-oxo-dGTP pyrophosphatase MutT (NUDIX family)
VRSAATLLLLADRPDLHVLLLRRRAASDFVPGMVVFPGGALDAADASPEVLARCADLDDGEASRRLGLPRQGLAYWVAAVRETFEEAGVLLARRGARPLSLSEPEAAERFAALRDQVDRGQLRLADLLRAEDLCLDAAAIHYAARWITPEGPRRRYDTRFFVAALPQGQQAGHDEREAVHSEWVRPADALARCEAGELAMLPPTNGMLRLLAAYSRCQEALEAAARHQHGPDVPVRLGGEGKRWRVLLPGDPDYQRGTTPIRAWVRFGVDDERTAQRAEGRG